jgi:hypothetical protein
VFIKGCLTQQYLAFLFGEHEMDTGEGDNNNDDGGGISPYQSPRKK